MRQLLFNRQRPDGTWHDRRPTDVSLPTWLAYWLTYLGHEQSELAEHCVTRILDVQLPDGGWARRPGWQIDLSHSVQAYLALKLLGVQPSSKPLVRARRAIRKHGGADAADAPTRFILAVFGQISYDECPDVHDLQPCSHTSVKTREPLAVVVSRRTVCNVGLSRGARELFLQQPACWPKCLAGTREGRVPSAVNWMHDAWFRGTRAIRSKLHRSGYFDHAVAQIMARTAGDRVAELRCDELVWHMIALKATARESSSAHLETCSRWLDEFVDLHGEEVLPPTAARPLADTAHVAHALLQSGVPPVHPAIVAAAGCWRDMFGRFPATLTTSEICWVLSFVQPDRADDDTANLPPEIAVGQEWWESADARMIDPSGTSCQPQLWCGEHREDPGDLGIHFGSTTGRETEPGAANKEQLYETIMQLLLARQNRDGGWNESSAAERAAQDAFNCFAKIGREKFERAPSSPSVTGQALVAIGNVDRRHVGDVRERAVACLRDAQNADGSWNTAGVANTESTSWALCGLLAAGVSSDDDAVAAGLNWLIVHQNQNGGWELAPSVEMEFEPRSVSIAVTACALRALVAGGMFGHAAARKAVHYLVEDHDSHGGGTDSVAFRYDEAAGQWYQSELRAIAGSLIGLSQWMMTVAAHSAAQDRAQLRLVGAGRD